MSSISRVRGTRTVPAHPPIELVAIDLDGTLLDDRKHIGDRTVRALRALPRHGVRVVIASARPPRSVRPFYKLLGLDTWQINYNGALIWDEPSQRVVFHRPMEGAMVREMVEVARDLFEEVVVTCEILDQWYTDRVEQPYTTETGRLYAPDVVAPLATFVSQPITKLLLLGEPRTIAHIEGVLTTRFGERVSIVRSEGELLQIMDARVTKAMALKRVARHYRVAMANVLALGDAPNDVEMLDAAGVGVAMANSLPMVQKVADWVGPSNNDLGVLAALKRYGLVHE
jgi:5-amino-6-(5-phospho-D-ribitylamino)uracil phosphatase